MSYRHSRLYAGILIGWSVVAVALAAVGGPSWLNTPIVGTYTLLAVGIAVVLAGRIRDIPTAIGVSVAAGVGSLMLASELFLIVNRLQPLATLALQAVVVCGLAVWSFVRGAGKSAPKESQATPSTGVGELG